MFRPAPSYRRTLPGPNTLIPTLRPRAFKADAIVAEIIKCCIGEVTFAELVDELAKSYAAPPEKILAEASTLLRGLADKRPVEL
jgi:Coenzyme PQQ synthesis protein D (PqqD)